MMQNEEEDERQGEREGCKGVFRHRHSTTLASIDTGLHDSCTHLLAEAQDYVFRKYTVVG